VTPEEYRNFPHRRARASREHELQSACVEWFRYAHPSLSRLLISVPNGASLSGRGRTWKYLEREGAVAGAADLLLLVPRGQYGYLAIEMKQGRGRHRENQRTWGAEVEAAGGRYVVCRGSMDFQELIQQYLETNS
jgi:hypothetical protein